jgi:hypothetical protein
MQRLRNRRRNLPSKRLTSRCQAVEIPSSTPSGTIARMYPSGHRAPWRTNKTIARPFSEISTQAGGTRLVVSSMVMDAGGWANSGISTLQYRDGRYFCVQFWVIIDSLASQCQCLSAICGFGGIHLGCWMLWDSQGADSWCLEASHSGVVWPVLSGVDPRSKMGHGPGVCSRLSAMSRIWRGRAGSADETTDAIRAVACTRFVGPRQKQPPSLMKGAQPSLKPSTQGKEMHPAARAQETQGKANPKAKRNRAPASGHPRP